MKTEDIVKAAEERLAEIEAEAKKLRAIIAAAKGPSIAPFVSPPIPMTIYPTRLSFNYGLKPTDREMFGNLEIHPFDGLVVGGSQHAEPNVRFASDSSDGGKWD